MTRKFAAFSLILPLLLLAAPAGAQTRLAAQATALADLHDSLNLTPAQEPAWQAYRAGLAPDPEIAARHRAAEALLATVPTPQRIALIDAQMQADLDDFRHQGEAMKAFYAVLDPVQRRVFDAQTAPRPDPSQAAGPAQP